LTSIKLYEHKGKTTIAAYDVADTELAKLYGIVTIDHKHRIIHFEEKPQKPKSTLSSTGIYFYPKEAVFQLIHYINTGGKMDKAGDFLEWLYQRENIFCYVTKERWFDIGSLDQLDKAKSEFKHKTDAKTIVVTGGAGFLGSHLCDYLISKGDYVICVDNLFYWQKREY
jgi:glucose-1-phosphate thymidylyltransferase